jgi:OFA family oxalate/formate antiporter-like MFS transporter
VLPASRTFKRSRLVEGITPHLFYGWVVVAMCFLAQMLTSVSMQGLSTYVVPLEHEFGWGAAETAAGRSVQQVNALFGPANGWLVDRIGARWVMSVGVLLFSLGFVLFSQIDSLITYYAACFLMELANQLVGLLVISVAINHWFRRKRSTATGIAVVGFAAAGAVCVPAIVWIQDAFGWRTAALWTGLGILVVGLPIIVFMRNAPEPYALLPDGDRPARAATDAAAAQQGGASVSFTLREALRTRAFWLIAAGLALAMLVQSAVTVWQFPYIEGILDRGTSASILTVLNVFNIGGRLVGGWLGDRLPKHHLLGLDLAGTCLAVMLLAFATSVPWLLVYGALYGFAWGVRTPVVQAIQGDYFGGRAFGRLVGISQTLSAPPSILAPVLVGFAVDQQKSYAPSLLVLAAVCGLAAILFELARRPPAPRRLAFSSVR